MARRRDRKFSRSPALDGFDGFSPVPSSSLLANRANREKLRALPRTTTARPKAHQTHSPTIEGLDGFSPAPASALHLARQKRRNPNPLARPLPTPPGSGSGSAAVGRQQRMGYDKEGDEYVYPGPRSGSVPLPAIPPPTLADLTQGELPRTPAVRRGPPVPDVPGLMPGRGRGRTRGRGRRGRVRGRGGARGLPLPPVPTVRMIQSVDAYDKGKEGVDVESEEEIGTLVVEDEAAGAESVDSVGDVGAVAAVEVEVTEAGAEAEEKQKEVGEVAEEGASKAVAAATTESETGDSAAAGSSEE